MNQNLPKQKYNDTISHSTSTIDDIDVQSTVRLAVGGMTCVACSRAIIDAVSEIEGVSDIVVNQVGNCASAVIARGDLAQAIATRIEDIGYECTVVSVTPIGHHVGASGAKEDQTRSVALELKGLESIPSDIVDVLGRLESKVVVLQSHDRDPRNVIRISYSPSAPHFTIRTILGALSAAVSPSTAVISIWHPPSSDEISRRIYRTDQMKLLRHLLVAIAAAIPIFIIGIVYMSLVNERNPGRVYFQQKMWAGQVTRGEWALFILATPVMFYSAKDFHLRSLQELWHMWRPGSRATLSTRFLRFGSMNLLISLGVSVAYFASIAELAISATNTNGASVESSGSTTYFDSVGFLTMFLLIGKYIEAFSKHQAANAITLLGKLRGSDALLVRQDTTPSFSSSSLQNGIKSKSESEESSSSHGRLLSDSKVQKISIDLLEVGDIVRVPPGSTPPADGVIVSSELTHFDESSLTGESRNVVKNTGDHIFVGTFNKLRAVDMRVDAIDGGTMLEQVIEAVRQGQTKPAPIERIVDVITSYFAPAVTGLAIITWIVWLALGLGGALEADTLANTVGGWPFWSLEFAIAVFVIACPCGIGLAAPTALLVGSGLAAKHGILARGGGEAFQEASQIDVIVFDKTGTLTEGSEPKVTDVKLCSTPSLSTEKGDWLGHDVDASLRSGIISGAVLRLASASSHPLCISLRQYYQGDNSSSIIGSDVEELPGCGMKALFRLQQSPTASELNALLGNETWLREFGVVPNQEELDFLHQVKSEGKSVVLLAVSVAGTYVFTIVAIFAIADPIRPEVPSVISQLHSQGIETWMISGDNEITAKAVARSVGILTENVIAGVLPQEKADKVRWLQTLPQITNVSGRGNSGRKSRKDRRIVAMVGDGINDAPALTAADVGIAMGSGSDIALSSAKFVLLSSDLRTLLILTDLSKKIFRRIKFNFAWATVYNLIALPIAAGAIYPAGHARLGPVWSSLAMALSSTSVVCSSLLLRLYKKPQSHAARNDGNMATKDGPKSEV